MKYFVFLLMIGTASMAQVTLFVGTDGNNNNPGSESQPFRGIQFGIDQLSAGDTLVVKTGAYSEIVGFQGMTHSGTLNNPITLKAQSGVVIDANGFTPLGRQGIITIADASHVVIDGFELKNFKTADGLEINDSPVGILVQGNSTHVVIKNNVIHGIQNRSTCGQSTDCGPGANGIAVYGDKVAGISDIELINNEVYDCVLAASESFTINGNVNRFKIINNYVHDNNNIAFDFIGYEQDVCGACDAESNRARNGYVKGNRAINNSIKLAVGGFNTNPWYENDDGNAGGFYVDGGRNIIFDGNYSSQNDMGFEFASEHSGKSSEDLLMINNVIYNNREVGLSLGGYAESSAAEGGGSAQRIRVFNNSFYHNKGWGTEIVFAFRVIDFMAINNIFYGTADVADNFGSENNGQHQNTHWLNNMWWALDNSNTNGLPETNPLVNDPLYVDPENGNLNIHLTSPARDTGLLQVNIDSWNSPFWVGLFGSAGILAHGSEDINGESRIENNSIDRGADEYGNDVVFSNGFETF